MRSTREEKRCVIATLNVVEVLHQLALGADREQRLDQYGVDQHPHLAHDGSGKVALIEQRYRPRPVDGHGD